MADENIKDQMAQIRQRIQQKKESSKSLTGIFQTAKAETTKTAPKRTLTAIKEIEADTRILGAVAGYLDIVSASQIDLVEKTFPITTTVLFELAKSMIDGEFGNQIAADARGMHENLLEWPFLLKILIVKALDSSEELEIFPSSALEELKPLKSKISSEKLEKWLYNEDGNKDILFQKIKTFITSIKLSHHQEVCLKRIFKKYLNNLANPSSSSIDLMLKKEKSMEKTVKQAFTIKNSSERTKSIGNIVGSLLQSNNVGQAIQIVGSIKAKKEVSKPLINLVKQLLNPKRRDIDSLIAENKLDEAVEIAGSLAEEHERDKVYQRLISGLALHRQVDKALEIAERISDPDVRDFSLSSLVNGLISRLDFESAIRVVQMIGEREYRDDANGYIVRKFLEHLSFADAMAFVSNISDPLERSRAAKVILSWVRSTHDQKKIDEVSSLFKLAM